MPVRDCQYIPNKPSKGCCLSRGSQLRLQSSGSKTCSPHLLPAKVQRICHALQAKDQCSIRQCIQGFGKLLKHSTVSRYILESEEVYKMTPEQCRNAHDVNQISLTLGTSVLTLWTSKLGRQASISFLHGEVFSNHTCVGAKTEEKL